MKKRYNNNNQARPGSAVFKRIACSDRQLKTALKEKSAQNSAQLSNDNNNYTAKSKGTRKYSHN